VQQQKKTKQNKAKQKATKKNNESDKVKVKRAKSSSSTLSYNRIVLFALNAL
jgi:hypothetical protein